MLKVNVKKLTEQKLPDWSLIFQNHLKNNKIKFFAKLFFYPFYVATVCWWKSQELCTLELSMDLKE